MRVLDTMNEFVGLVQKADNIELFRQLVELQMQVVALVEENRALKERLPLMENLVFQHNAYWLGDVGPHCSRCWDAEQKLVRLHSTDEMFQRCPKCTQQAFGVKP